MNKQLISIVSTAYNEEESIAVFMNEVERVMQELPDYEYEMILVDDGSRDQTWPILVVAAQEKQNVKGIRLSRNFGHQNALSAGLDSAQGAAVIYCDVDLQHPPALFPALIEQWQGGNKIVHTKRTQTAGEGWLKQNLSALFYHLMGAISEIEIEGGVADFKLIDQVVLDKLRTMPERSRFIRGLVPWLGFTSSVVEFSAPARQHGRASYSFDKSLRLAQYGVLSFSTKPLQWIGIIGLGLMFGSAMALLFQIVRLLVTGNWFFSPVFTLLLVNTFLVGLVIACLGLVALYINQIQREVTNRPLYIVAETTDQNEPT